MGAAVAAVRARRGRQGGSEVIGQQSFSAVAKGKTGTLADAKRTEAVALGRNHR